MFLLDYSLHLVCSAVCVVISILLFVLHIKQEKEKSFVKVRRYLAYSILIDSFTYFIGAILISMGVGCFILKHFIVPTAFYFQLYFMTFALIELMFSPEVTRHKKLLLPLPVLVLSIFYTAKYIAFSGDIFSIQNYIDFSETSVAVTLSRILSYVFVAEMILCMFWLLKASISYQKRIENYFSGSQALGGCKLTYIIYGFLAYVFFEVMGNLTKDRTIELVLISLSTLMVFVLTIYILNKKNTYREMSSAFVEDLTEFDDTPSEETVKSQSPDNSQESDGVQTSGTVNANETVLSTSSERRRIEDLICAWTERDEKPYLEEGLTLAQTADDIGVSPRFLSGFLNDIYEMNFNTWINNLRIEEVKRLIDAGTDKSMTDLAVMAGFTDLPAMSRIFKRITGVTPSQYRSESRKNSRIQA